MVDDEAKIVAENLTEISEPDKDVPIEVAAASEEPPSKMVIRVLQKISNLIVLCVLKENYFHQFYLICSRNCITNPICLNNLCNLL